MPRVALALLLSLFGLAPVAAARTPDGFFGVMADGPLFEAPTDLDRELRLMRSSGVETIRVAFDWRLIEPARGTVDFTLTDVLVQSAARRRLRLLPVVIWAPEWARRDPGRQASPPKPGPYARIVAKLARRYGRGGSFWSEHPALPQRPLREWQIWNEPTVENFWTLQPWAEDYAQLLRRSARSLRRADPRARVVTAGLVYESWKALEQLYEAGAKGSFEVVALHPFTDRPKGLLKIIGRSREVMRRHGDGRRPVFLTEISWPSSLDKIGRRYGYETSERGMAQKIRNAYPLIARARKRLRIERAYWYTWLTREEDPRYPFDYAGLRKLTPDGTIVSKPGLQAFSETVSSLRG